MSKNGQNNRGYKNPNTPQWGVRKFPDSWGRTVLSVQWHSEGAKLGKYLKARGMTKEQALALCRLMKRGALGI